MSVDVQALTILARIENFHLARIEIGESGRRTSFATLHELATLDDPLATWIEPDPFTSRLRVVDDAV